MTLVSLAFDILFKILLSLDFFYIFFGAILYSNCFELL